MTILASTLTDWIGAISAAVIGLLGFGFAVWQWRASGFRPAMSATVDSDRRTIQVDIDNRGRAAGAIWQVTPVRLRNELNDPVDFDLDGFPNGYEAKDLQGFATMRLVLRGKMPPGAAEPAQFAEDVEVLVEWGSGKETYLEPEHVPNMSFWTNTTRLPPSTT